MTDQDPEWRLVPSVPTPEMLKAWLDAPGIPSHELDQHNELSGLLPAYKAMIGAAPSPSASSVPDIKSLANRFLAWPLPRTVAADLCATNNSYAFPRSGTNLLSAEEAEAMLLHVLEGVAPTANPAPSAMTDEQRGALGWAISMAEADGFLSTARDLIALLQANGAKHD